MLVRLRFALALALVAAFGSGLGRTAQAAERPLALFSAPSLDLGRHLQFLPSAQIDGGALDFIPKGDLADDDIEWGLEVGKWVATSALSLGGDFLFQHYMKADDGMKAVPARQRVVRWSLLQLAAMPLVSGTAGYLIGNASEMHDVGFGWPLAAAYASELVLVGVRIGLAFGINDVQNDALKTGTDVLGSYVYVDYILHGLLVPTALTYFSIRSRSAKGYSVQRRDERPTPELVAEVRGTFEADTDSVVRRSQAASAPLAVTAPVANFVF